MTIISPPLLSVSHSITGRQWVLRGGIEAERNGLAMAQRYNLPEPLTRTMAARGVMGAEALSWLTPTMRDLLL